MATVKQITDLYQDYLGRTPSADEIKTWQDTNASFKDISTGIRLSAESGTFAANPQSFGQLIDVLYREQLGRAADPEGREDYIKALQSGKSLADVAQELNQSLEGQNFDTQFITSLYRQNLARNPEQAGFQWWLSMAQDAGYTPAELDSILQESAMAEQINRGITSGTNFTEMELAALEADPFGGRYITNSIYDLLPDAVNVSTIGNRQAQFVNPVTQQMVSSNYGGGGSTWSQTAGLNVLNTPAVNAAVQRALDSGAMTPEEYRTMYSQLQDATNMNDVYAAFNAPQAQVVIDAVRGQQIGEANTLAQARAEAAQRQAVLSAQDPGYYQANFPLADAYAAAGLDYPFGSDAFSGYDTRVGQANVVNDQNFNTQVGNLVNSLYGQFGGAQDMVTPLTGQYYSETGLQPGYTPPGATGTMFRSGVAGYTPNLPTMFQFGAPPVDSTFQPYRPGAFQPAGVTTGGFITGYTADGQPIYSQYNNPSQNVVLPAQREIAEQTYNASPITEANFDAQAYLAANPDVANNWASSPYQHYIQYGQGEGRTATRLPFTYVQPSQLVNPSANLQTIGATNNFFTAPNGQIYASEAAYNAMANAGGGGGG
jgi:hypothetical protein